MIFLVQKFFSLLKKKSFFYVARLKGFQRKIFSKTIETSVLAKKNSERSVSNLSAYLSSQFHRCYSKRFVRFESCCFSFEWCSWVVHCFRLVWKWRQSCGYFCCVERIVVVLLRCQMHVFLSINIDKIFNQICVRQLNSAVWNCSKCPKKLNSSYSLSIEKSIEMTP